MELYHKIETIYKRDMEGNKKLIEGLFRNEAIEYLKDLQWNFTEKIDGTNIRVYWDGHRVSFGGRSDNAQIPAHLINRLNDLFSGETNEQIFEEKFGETEVTLFGEGYGPKIQSGGLYKESVDFILFDVMINNKFLSTENCLNIAKSFNIDYVPVVLKGTINDAVSYVKNNQLSKIGKANMEGLVGRPLVELFDSQGNRIIVKIKARDFKED